MTQNFWREEKERLSHVMACIFTSKHCKPGLLYALMQCKSTDWSISVIVYPCIFLTCLLFFEPVGITFSRFYSTQKINFFSLLIFTFNSKISHLLGRTFRGCSLKKATKWPKIHDKILASLCLGSFHSIGTLSSNLLQK